MIGRLALAARANRAACFALAIIVAAGGYLRLHNLGAADLVLEELNHYYVGQSLAAGAEPTLPSGYAYTRGTGYSRLTEVVGRILEPPEVAVRLPSAIFGTASVVVMAVGAWAIAGPGAAVAATLLIAVYPEAVIQSRTGRFYMLQFLFGLVALLGGWAVMRDRAVAADSAAAQVPAGGSGRGEVARVVESGAVRAGRIVGAAVAILALSIAVQLQVTALATALAFWIALAVAGGLELVRRGVGAMRDHLPAQLALVTGVAALIGLAARPGLLPELALRASSTPFWARPQRDVQLYYLEILTTYFPMIGLIGLASFAYLIARKPRLGLYLLVMFAVPMLALSLALPFKADRFALLAMPPLFIAIGAAVSLGVSDLRARAAAHRRTRGALAMRGAAVLVAALPGITAFPASGMLWYGYDRIHTADWTTAERLLATLPIAADLPIGTTRSLAAHYYWNRVDFSVSIGHLERWDSEAGHASGADPVGGAYVMREPGSPDIYTGVPVLPYAESIRRHFGTSHDAVVIAIDEASLTTRMVDPDLLGRLESEAVEVCQGQCGALSVYVWRLRSAHAAPTAISS